MAPRKIQNVSLTKKMQTKNSNRLESTPQLRRCIPSRSVKNKLGRLGSIPVHVLEEIFIYLDVASLRRLAASSQELSNLILDFLYSFRGLMWVFKHSYVISNIGVTIFPKEKCERLGQLLRVITRHMSMDAVILVITNYIERMDTMATKEMQTNRSNTLKAYGMILAVLLKGQNDVNLDKAVRAVEKEAERLGCTVKVLTNTLGKYPVHEMRLRQLYRMVLLDPCEEASERAGLLEMMLKPYTMVVRAKLLFILYGPTREGNGGTLMWYILPNCLVLSDFQAEFLLGELSIALRDLYTLGLWPGTALGQLVRALFCTPLQWMSSNCALLLTMCGEYVITNYLCTILHPRSSQMKLDVLTNCCAELFISLINVKITNPDMGKTVDMSRVLGAVLMKVSTHKKTRFKFLASLWDIASTQITSGIASTPMVHQRRVFEAIALFQGLIAVEHQFWDRGGKNLF